VSEGAIEWHHFDQSTFLPIAHWGIQLQVSRNVAVTILLGDIFIRYLQHSISWYTAPATIHGRMVLCWLICTIHSILG
jgi:hypothetical protein